MSVSQDHLDGNSLEFIEGLFEDYLSDPTSVPEDWRKYFESQAWSGHTSGRLKPEVKTQSFFELREEQAGVAKLGQSSGLSGSSGAKGNGAQGAAVTSKPTTGSVVSSSHPGSGHARTVATPTTLTSAAAPMPSVSISEIHSSSGHVTGTGTGKRIIRSDALNIGLQHRVDALIRNCRMRGHRIAKLDPLGLPREAPPELDPAYYGLTEADMEHMVMFSVHPTRHEMRTVRQVIESLHNTYCRYIGVQYMHIDDLGVREWLQERMEPTENRIVLGREEQLRILTRLTDAVIFEEFVQKKYQGAKTFSLEGGETLIPMLEMAIDRAGEQGVRQMVLAMAHRGRLNVLANVMGKSAQEIFLEFEDEGAEEKLGRGDVKYHMGYSTDWVTATGKRIHLSLCFNPSHLEFINPVAMGRMRAKTDRYNDLKRDRGLAIMIHGDAAFSGEGVVQETLNLARLPAYTIGGTLHILLNNQIGFTTGPEQGRSVLYATSVARMMPCPILHVNGEHPEAVAQAVSLAMEFRWQFKRDVIIDMYCYRRRGHNEGDEPSFTQPLLYKAIEQRKSVRDGYLEHLLEMGGVTLEEADMIAAQRREHLERELAKARGHVPLARPVASVGNWKPYEGGSDTTVPDVDTGVAHERLQELLWQLVKLPATFTPHPKIERFLQARSEMAEGKRGLDWSAGETLAYASLAVEGTRIRMSGQDCERGTFSHRHAVLHDYNDGKRYMPLQHLSSQQAMVEIYNSPLSEVGVLGFEYGFSLDYPEALVIWEAQFGDFVNVAQVIIDQFIVSGEDKWRRLSGLTLLLPHGFEGQGPEHSSARLERLLVLAAEDNIQIANPTTPAQMFHLLRRQAIRPWRKPLFVLTPKSLLRHPKAVSPLSELTTGRFQRIISDPVVEPAKARRVLMCSGKIYYDLMERREKLQLTDQVAIVRVEQLFPLSDEHLLDVLGPYPHRTPVYWVQEEPENMGALRFFKARYFNLLFERWPLMYISRPISASPATGSHGAHKLEQEAILTTAFDLL